MTIKEVAQLAGVSPAAVSRYLNSGSLSEEKRVRVERVIRETGYRPDVTAQTLRTGRFRQVGVILPRLRSDSMSQVTAGIAAQLDSSGWLMMLGCTEEDPARELRYLAAMQENRMAGIILMGTTFTPEHAAAFANCKIPVVVTGQRFPGMPCIYHDDFHATRELTRRMLARGRRHIAYLGVSQQDAAAGEARLLGVQTALQEAGFSLDELLCRIGGFEARSGSADTAELMKAHPEVDGIICATDTIALGALDALRSIGVRVPEQVSLVGVGDSWAGTISSPPLTTARLYFHQCGEEAARLLLELIEHPDKAGPVRQTMLGYTLVERGSL